jgi:adenylate cyclase
MQRTLAAILFADIAGYTRLMDQYEAETYLRLMQVIEEIVEPAVAAANGSIVKNTGDGFLARFGSVNEAFRCATGIQQGVDSREAGQPAEKRIAFRMGLHVGDIVVEARDVYGAGVNLAARLQEIAAPGGLAISSSVREQLGAGLKLPITDLGNVSLKNIADPVRAFQVELTQPQRQQARVAGARRHSRPSIAVLPFIEYGAKAEGSLIGDAISEDAIAALASLPDLFVISRNSTLRYREPQPNIQAIGRELGVRYICSGAVRRSGNRLRVSAEVADVESRTVIATDRFEGDTSDLFALQDRLTERVLQTIAPHIREAELLRVRNKRTDSLDAYEYMLRGLDLLYRLDFAEFERAHKMFERSISLNEDYAAPYAFTALWHSIRFQQGWSPDGAKDLKSVDEFAAAALLRDQNDVWALSLSGICARSCSVTSTRPSLCSIVRFALAPTPPSPGHAAAPPLTTSARRPRRGAGPRKRYAYRRSIRIYFSRTARWLLRPTSRATTKRRSLGPAIARGKSDVPANLRFLAASLAGNGQLEDARRVGESLRRLDPHFQVRNFLQTYAVQDEQFKARLGEHLLAAGLPP